MSKIKKFVRIIRGLMDALEVHGSTLFLFTIFITMFLQVVLRYLFNKPSPALFEVTQYAFPWGTLLGAACAQRYRDHIRFNILYDKFPKRVRLVIDVIFDFAIVGLFALSMPEVFHQTFWYYMLRSEVLDIPWTYLVFCLPLFLILVIIHNLVHIYHAIREIITGIPYQPEAKPWL
jgi:TRAP-type C4-dicarboxylate transport system permease small subunit